MKKLIVVLIVIFAFTLLSGCINPPICGNGVCESGESPNTCSQDCPPHNNLCGNGTIDINEQCDDGGNVSLDGCSSTCQIEIVCNDTDGNNWFTKGTTTESINGVVMPGRIGEDYCNDANTLTEYECTAPFYMGNKLHMSQGLGGKCPNGCKDGVCIGESQGEDYFTVYVNDNHCRIDECTFLAQRDKNIYIELTDPNFNENNAPSVLLEDINSIVLKSERMEMVKEGKFALNFFIPKSNNEQVLKFSKNGNGSFFKLYSASHSGEDQNFEEIKLLPYIINLDEWQIKKVVDSNSQKKIQFVFDTLGVEYPFDRLERLAINTTIGADGIKGFLNYSPFDERANNFEILIVRGWSNCDLNNMHATNYCFKPLLYDIIDELAKPFDDPGQERVKRYFGQLGRTERENAGFDGGMNLNIYSEEDIASGRPANIVTHEMGHVFLLGDEYFEVPDFYEVGTPNIDVEGCPKWCSGELDTTKTGYSDYLELKNCLAPYIGSNGQFTNYSANREQIDSCFTVEIDMGEKIDYASRYPNMAKWDFGKGCITGAGCYFSAHGWLEWRSSEDSIMNYALGTEFNAVSKRALRDRLCVLLGNC